MSMPPGMPQFNQPADKAKLDQEFQANSTKGSTIDGLTVRYADIPGPRGEASWKDVPAGYQGQLGVYLMPSFATDGMTLYVMSMWHWWKSGRYPRGMSVGCPGRDTCEVCQAAGPLRDHPDERVAERAKSFGYPRRKWLYNCVLMAPMPIHAHIYEDGVLRPWVLGATKTQQDALANVCRLKHRSISDAVDPRYGNPFILAKKKTGRGEMDVEYSVVDMPPQMLPQEYWPALNALWDLNRLVRQSTAEERRSAAVDMGFVAMQSLVQVPQGYQISVQQQQAAPPQPQQTAYPAAPGMGMPGYPAPVAPQTPYFTPGQPPAGYSSEPLAPQQPAYQATPTREQQLAFPPPPLPAAPPAPPAYGNYAQMPGSQAQPLPPPIPQAAPGASFYAPQPAVPGQVPPLQVMPAPMPMMPPAPQMPSYMPPADSSAVPPPPTPALPPNLAQLEQLQRQMMGQK